MGLSDFGAREKTGFAGHLEVLEGPTGRRSWPDTLKARIVRESFEPDASVASVARRYGIRPQQLTNWRRAAREGRLVLPWDEEAPGFVPLVVEEDAATSAQPASGSAERGDIIEIEMADLVLRLPVQTDEERIAAVIAALRRSA